MQDAVKAGKLTYAELTLYFLARIQQYDETLRTMIELNPDALKEAQAADQRLKDGKATGLMLGLPVTLKDNIETAAPMHTTGGAEILLNNQPKADASFVKQLRDAGAVILGKANLSELAGGVSSQAGFSAVGGQVVNPHGNYSPAGSSAGSGAGTAAYETMVSVGSETSGSLIAPASWNGVVGMYPGRGVVDGANVIPLVKNNDSAGPMGRSVKDVAALLAVIDTKDTDYVAGLDAKALNGVNAAFLKSDVLAQKPSALEDTSDNAAVAQLIEKGLTQAGAKVTAIELTPAGIGQQVNTLLGGMLMGGVRHDMVSYLVDAGTPVKTLEDLAAYNLAVPETRIPTGQGTIDTSLPITQLMGLKDYQEFVTQGKELATAVLDAAFADNKADVLVSVTNYHSPLYATANYPAISVPLGKRKNGMPVGVTLIGKPGSEAKLLSYAYALEQATKLRVDPDLSKVAAVSADASAAATSKFSPAWKSVSCDTFNLIKDIAEASDCGYVTVPVRHDNPDGPTIQLGVVRIRSIAEKPASDPVLFEQGGPGGSTIGFFASAGQIAKMLEFLKARDVVLVEERGTQYSVPFLDCAQPLEQAIAIAKGQAKDDGSYVNACKARWDKQGIDLSAFNDTENAADMYSVVDALGYDQFNYYGVSYGTESASSS